MNVEEYLRMFREHSQDLIEMMDSLSRIGIRMKAISENLVEVTNEGKKVLERVEKVVKRKPQ